VFGRLGSHHIFFPFLAVLDDSGGPDARTVGTGRIAPHFYPVKLRKYPIF